MELLRRCGLRKSKGIPLWSILSYIFSNVFRDRSMYMQQKSGKCTAGFSKNTYYRFMQNPHINWLRLTILLAERIVNGHLKDLTSDQRADCFVFDDSLYSRTGYKKTELAAKVFDYVSMTYKKGFRMMTMGWTCPNRFITLVLKERSECHRDDQEDRQAHNRGQEANYGPIKGERSSLESRAHCQVRHV